MSKQTIVSKKIVPQIKTIKNDNHIHYHNHKSIRLDDDIKKINSHISKSNLNDDDSKNVFTHNHNYINDSNYDRKK